MTHQLPRLFAATLLALLVAGSSSAQKNGTQGSPPPSQPANPGSVGRQPGAVQPTSPQMQTPTYVNGRILMETGQPVPEPVSVALNCGMSSLQVIRTDLKGYFQFTLGAGPQGNVDLSASNSSPMAGINGRNPFGGSGGFGTAAGSLTGCELQVSVPGYQPLMKTITDHPDIGGIDVGTLMLRRISGVQGSSISVTSLLVPGDARKEFEKGTKDARSNHMDSAAQHLEKAVSQYDKYAAAWSELGSIYAARQEKRKLSRPLPKRLPPIPNTSRPT